MILTSIIHFSNFNLHEIPIITPPDCELCRRGLMRLDILFTCLMRTLSLESWWQRRFHLVSLIHSGHIVASALAFHFTQQ
jgi:hypothetical protein